MADHDYTFDPYYDSEDDDPGDPVVYVKSDDKEKQKEILHAQLPAYMFAGSCTNNLPINTTCRSKISSLGRGIGRGCGRVQKTNAVSNEDAKQIRGPKFILPSDTEMKKAPTSRGKEPLWGSTTSAKRAPPELLEAHQRKLQQSSCNSGAFGQTIYKTNNWTAQNTDASLYESKSHPVSTEYMHDEIILDSPSGSPPTLMQARLNSIAERARKEQEEKDFQRESRIAEFMSMNPLIDAEWFISYVAAGCTLKDKILYKVFGTDRAEIPQGNYHENEAWMREIQEIWNARGTKADYPLLKYFFQAENPYLTTLYLVEHAHNTNGNLSGLVLKEFVKWISLHREKYTDCLHQTVKVKAFILGMCGKNMLNFDTTVKAFELCHSQNEYLLPLIQLMVARQEFKEASICAAKLNLQHMFDITDIVLPLIFQDKWGLVESYVFRNYEQQKALLILLDGFVADEQKLTETILGSTVPNIKRDKLTTKGLTKAAIRLLKLYNVETEFCPNIMREKSRKALRYLLYKRYQEKTVELNQWDDMIMSCIDESESMQLYCVDHLVDYLEMHEAARWALYYKLPEDELPMQVVDIIHKDYDSIVPVGELDRSEVSEVFVDYYHELTLHEDDIEVVSTREAFYACLRHICESRTGVVGMDGEWRPTFGAALASRMALLQLAVSDRVFLLDMITLAEVNEEDDWAVFAAQIFANDELIKLGYGFDSDLQMLIKTFPCMKDGLKAMEKMVDIQMLFSQVKKQAPEAFDSDQLAASSQSSLSDSPKKVVKTEERGLSDVVRLCLGRPLDKREQMSNWEKRPLRREQIIYAALDAYCLLEIYEVLQNRVENLQLDIDLAPRLGVTVKPKLSKMDKKKLRVSDPKKLPEHVFKNNTEAPNPPSRSGPPIRPGDLSVVCDNMLQGLGRQLQCCGVDVVILSDGQDHDDCAKIARKENRVILTSGLPYITLRSQVPNGCCYNVPHGKAKDQCAHVLKYLNVVVNEDDIFSRCQACNGNKYLYIHPDEMREAWLRVNQAQPKVASSLSQIAKGLLQGTSSRGDQQQEKFSKLHREWTRDTSQSGSGDLEFDHIDMDTLCVGSGVRIQVDKIPEAMLCRDVFYVCAGCGKVFWEGSHFAKVCEQFRHVIVDDMKEAKS